MPAILVIEGMAQTAGALCMHHLAAKKPPLIYFMGIDKAARLRRQVVPGDVHSRGRVWRYRGQAVVDEILVARAEFSAAIVDTAHQDDQPNRTDQVVS